MATQTARAKRFAVVAGVDATSASDEVLAEAVAASRHGLIHVVYAIAPEHARSGAAIAKLDAALQEGAERLQRYLDRRRRRLALDQCRIVAHVRSERPARAIVQLAVDVDANLIIVGASTRHPILRLWRPTASETILRDAPCKVLVVGAASPAHTKSVEVEPPCPKCEEVREASDGAELWCVEHGRTALPRHVFRYARELAFDSTPPPGGH